VRAPGEFRIGEAAGFGGGDAQQGPQLLSVVHAAGEDQDTLARSVRRGPALEPVLGGEPHEATAQPDAPLRPEAAAVGPVGFQGRVHALQVPQGHRFAVSMENAENRAHCFLSWRLRASV